MKQLQNKQFLLWKFLFLLRRSKTNDLQMKRYVNNFNIVYFTKQNSLR